MFFLNCLLISALSNMYGIVKEENRLLKFLHMDSLILVLAGFLFLMHLGNNANASNSYFQIAFLVSAALLFCISIAKIKNKWTINATVGFFSSLFIAYAIGSNYLFFIDKENSGLINPKFIHHDTPCSNQAFIYFTKKGNELYYRCPKENAPDLFIVIGNQFNFPLLPWPSFYEGTSKAIEHALHTREENQIYIDKEHVISIEKNNE